MTNLGAPIGQVLVCGTLRDGLGLAVEHCTVCAEAEPAGMPALLQPEPVRVQTDAAGTFQLLLPEGVRYCVSLFPRELAPRLLRRAVGGRGLPRIDLGEVVLRENPGLVVAVRSVGGAPFADAEVGVRLHLVPGDLPPLAAGVFERSAHTDAAGECRLSALAPGIYVLRAVAAGCRAIERTVQLAGEDAGPVRMSLTLTPAESVLGTAADAQGNPLPMLAVRLAGRGGVEVAGQTGADGSFELAATPDPPLRLGIDLPGGGFCWFGPVHPRTPLQLVLPCGKPVGGRVLAPDRTLVRKATVVFTPADGMPVQPGLFLTRAEVVTDADGAFRFGGLPTGRFFVDASSQDGNETQLGPAPLPDPMTILLEAPCRLAGKVVDPRGLALNRAVVECLPAGPLDASAPWLLAPEAAITSVHAGVVLTDTNGRFDFPVLAAGACRLRVTAQGLAPALTEPLDLQRGREAEPLHVRLGPASWIHGRLLRAGVGLADQRVQAQPARGGLAVASAWTEADGSFRIGPLAAASYSVIYACPGRQEPFTSLAPVVQQITLQEGQDLQLDLRFP
jgi:hypothetical protein